MVDFCDPCGESDSCLSMTECLDATNCRPECSNIGVSNGCFREESLNGACTWYWSGSEASENVANRAFTLDFGEPQIETKAKTVNRTHVRCVR